MYGLMILLIDMVHFFQQAFYQFFDIVFFTDFFQENDEFITAKPADNIG